jgi:Membrane domain of glycerophosphoryl diester phosphodiesterase
MSEAIGQPGQAALPRPLGIGEILSIAFQLYRRHWRTLLAIAAVVVVPLTLLQHLLGDLERTQRETTSYGGVVEVTPTWLGGIAGLLAALAGILMSLVLTGAITRAVAAEVAGEDPSVEQSYRFGFHRLGSVLLVSVLVGLATIGGLILATIGGLILSVGSSGFLILFVLFVIPGIYIGVRLAVSIEALVVEGRRGTEAMGRSWGLVGGHWWRAFGTLLVALLLIGIVNAVITAPFGATGWFVQAVAAAVATVVTLPYGVLVGVLLYLDLRARKERLTLEALRADLQASAA